MMTARLVRADRGHLLAYLSDYGVVVCRQCQFAIQPTALSSHLLRHQIYRSERRNLLECLSDLPLKDPEDVPLPPHSIDPIECLPVYSGLICVSCGHACISQKRMSQHWSEAHGERASQSVAARNAKLQTFFRGNKLRYFEVASEVDVLSGTEETESNATDPSPFLTGPETPNIHNLKTYFTPESNPMDQDYASLNLDLASLQYLHHFVIRTAATVPRPYEQLKFWTEEVVKEAFNETYLMFSILSTAAFHLSVITLENGHYSQSEEHQKAGFIYQEPALRGFRAAAAEPWKSKDSTALIATARLTGMQRNAQERLRNCTSQPIDFAMGEGPAAPILEYILLMRGSIEMHLLLQHRLPQCSEFILRGQSLDLMQPFVADQLLCEGPQPFLIYNVVSFLDTSDCQQRAGQPFNHFIDDRNLSRLCTKTLDLGSEDQISVEWIKATLHPLNLTEDQANTICCALRASIIPARNAYQQSLVDDTAPPFPPRSRFASLQIEEYERLRNFVQKMADCLSPRDKQDLRLVMPEFLAICHCFGKAKATEDDRGLVCAVESWVYSLRKEFINMVEELRPAALLVTAQFVRLVKTGNYWFVQEHPRRLMSVIRDNLPDVARSILDQSLT